MLFFFLWTTLTAFAQERDRPKHPRAIPPFFGFERRIEELSQKAITEKEIAQLRDQLDHSNDPNGLVKKFLREHDSVGSSLESLLENDLPNEVRAKMLKLVEPLLETKPFVGHIRSETANEVLQQLIDSQFREGFRLTLETAKRLPPSRVDPSDESKWKQEIALAQTWLDFHIERLQGKIQDARKASADPKASATLQTVSKNLAEFLDIKLARVKTTRDFVRFENAGKIGAWGALSRNSDIFGSEDTSRGLPWEYAEAQLRVLALEEIARRQEKPIAKTRKGSIHDRTRELSSRFLFALERRAILEAIASGDSTILNESARTGLNGFAFWGHLDSFLEHLDLEIGSPFALHITQEQFQTQRPSATSLIDRLPAPQYQGSTVSCLSQCVAAAAQAQAPETVLRLSVRNAHARAIWGEAPDLAKLSAKDLDEVAPSLDAVARILSSGLVADHHRPWVDKNEQIATPSPADCPILHWDSDPYRVQGELHSTILPAAEAIAQIDAALKRALISEQAVYPIIGIPAAYDEVEEWLHIRSEEWATQHVILIAGEGRDFDPVRNAFQDYYLVQNNSNPHCFFQKLPKKHLHGTLEVAWVSDVSIVKVVPTTDLHSPLIELPRIPESQRAK